MRELLSNISQFVGQLYADKSLALIYFLMISIKEDRYVAVVLHSNSPLFTSGLLLEKSKSKIIIKQYPKQIFKNNMFNVSGRNRGMAHPLSH